MTLRAPMTRTSAILRLQLVAAEHVERIGQRIESRRKELKLNRRELAQRVGGATNENAVYRWERGKHRPEDSTLELLALALEVDVAYFMTPEPVPGTPDLMGALPGRQSPQTQLDRLETKIDALLEHLKVVVVFDEMHDVSDPGAAFERETEPTGPPSSHSSDSSGVVARAHQAGSQEPPTPRRPRP